jgi:osmotically-inducible protein OsmY
MIRKDKDLRLDVLDELEWEPSIDAAAIGVAVYDGIVTLSGAVHSFTERLAAERATQRVHGVKAVANDLEVRLPGTHERTDSEIAAAAVSVLSWKPSVPTGRVKVAVNKGWITLDGDVDWNYQKRAASEAVHRLVGVRGVHNLIAVKPYASASDVKSRVEAAFRRSAQLDAPAVRAETPDGKVTLHGKAHFWWERKEALRTAWAVPGTTQVENLITIAHRDL